MRVVSRIHCVSILLLLLMFIVFIYFVASSTATEPSCQETVVRLETEIQGLIDVINSQHRYIQELHNSQAQQLENIPTSLLGSANHYRDCSDVFADGNVASGLYVVRPDGFPTALSVYCDMNSGGGWTVFQRRRNGRESFDRAWVEYKHGFGDLHSPHGEFWLGNEPLHHITSQETLKFILMPGKTQKNAKINHTTTNKIIEFWHQTKSVKQVQRLTKCRASIDIGNYDLRIDMEDFEGDQRYAEYKKFKVDAEQDQYQLHLGAYSGNAGDTLAAAHRPPSVRRKWTSPGSGSTGVKFSTYDHPSENVARCIRHSKSGWWFSRCDAGNLNGHYYNGPYQAMTSDGVVWYTWHGWWYSIKSVVMMMRAADA